MNLLVDALPETVEIDGGQHRICSDFRSCLRILLAFEDADLTMQEKIAVMLTNLYPRLPDNLPEALARGMWFLNAGRESQDPEEAPRLFSFRKDAALIYAAFRQTHGIDLSTAELHWWKFMALFMDLGADTAFCQLVSLRKRVKNNTATKEEKRAALEMGEAFELPELDDRTLEDREAEAEFLRHVSPEAL